MKTTTLGLGFAIAFAASAAALMPAAAQPRAGVGDPAAYCRARGNVDAPPARGAPGWMRRQLGMGPGQTAGIAWRCMGGRVFACVDGGASVHCAKADTRRIATSVMRAYCRSHPGQSIPGAVTGSDTVYNWGCAGRTPRVQRQWTRVDPRGFPRALWRDVTPRAH